MTDRTQDAEATDNELEQLRDALDRIEQWCRAYPVEVFVPLTDEQIRTANTVLSFADISIGALHAQWARHILSGIADIIATTRKE